VLQIATLSLKSFTDDINFKLTLKRASVNYDASVLGNIDSFFLNFWGTDRNLNQTPRSVAGSLQSHS